MKSQQKLFVTRKSSSKQRFASSMDDWTEEDDALLYGRRYATNPIATTANVTKVLLLQEFFPGTDREILQDVLIAAHYQVDVAAAMLGDLVRETTQRQFAQEVQQTAAATQSEIRPVVVLDVEMTDMDDEEDEDWSEVSTIVQGESELTPEDVHPWVMVQDEWEVVDMEGEKVHTFAEVLRRSAVNTPYVSQLPKLAIIEPETSRTQKTKKKKTSSYKTEPVAFDSCERSVKSFGARKRRFLKTRA
jgi:hypothetical protein